MGEYKLTYGQRFKAELGPFIAALIIFAVMCIYSWMNPDDFGSEVVLWVMRIAPIIILGSWQLYNVYDVKQINKQMNRYGNKGGKA